MQDNTLHEHIRNIILEVRNQIVQMHIKIH